MKMQEYIANGARLGWLINPQDRQVEIYRPGQQVEVLELPLTLSGEDVLPGFVLNYSEFSSNDSISLMIISSKDIVQTLCCDQLPSSLR